jgi:hypothetical protein
LVLHITRRVWVTRPAFGRQAFSAPVWDHSKIIGLRPMLMCVRPFRPHALPTPVAFSILSYSQFSIHNS